MSYLIHHEPTTPSTEMKKAIQVLAQAVSTPEQKEALDYLERELCLASAYITELQWDVEEGAALIKQTYITNDPIWSKEYLATWAVECFERLNDHKYRGLSCMVKDCETKEVCHG